MESFWKVVFYLILAVSVNAMVESKEGTMDEGGWSDWSPCSSTCGSTSTRFRLRNCNGAPGCLSFESEQCELNPCPVWGDWSPWSACPVSCGNGTESRTRKCSGGPGCKGEATEERICWHACDECVDNWGEDACYHLRDQEWCGTLPIMNENCASMCGDCNYECFCVNETGGRSMWSEWSPCSASCGGGVMVRQRSCDHAPHYCGLRSEEIERCNTGACMELGVCTKECGGGTVAIQECDENDPTNCWVKYDDCNTHACTAVTCDSSQVYRYRSNSSCCSPSTTPYQCGIYRLESNIIGGEEAIPSDWPWMALVILGRPDQGKIVYCGGSVIADRWVVTAAHCLTQFRHSPEAVRIGVGAKYLNGGKQIVPSKSVYLHSGFKFPKHDIALIELKEALVLLSDSHPKSKVSPICLPMGEETPSDTQCYATGWGAKDASNPKMSERLNQVKMRHFDMKVCQSLHRGSGGADLIDEFVTCAGRIRGGVDTCVGDSGGPLVCQRCSTCSWYLAGITSFGSANCGAARYPGVYTKVLAYEDWIYRIIGRRTETQDFNGTCTSG